MTPEQWLAYFAAQELANALAAIFAVFPDSEIIST